MGISLSHRVGDASIKEGINSTLEVHAKRSLDDSNLSQELSVLAQELSGLTRNLRTIFLPWKMSTVTFGVTCFLFGSAISTLVYARYVWSVTRIQEDEYMLRLKRMLEKNDDDDDE